VGSPAIRVTPVDGRASLQQFLALPAQIYCDDPAWIQPLTFERLQHLDPKKNPFFARAEMACWTAWRGDRCIGRISAQVNRAHLEHHQDATGHFGFLEAEDDPEAFAALFEAAETWLRARGLRRAMGPFSLSINDESGLLIEGFETAPYVMMGHARPYYAVRVAEQGYARSKDLIAYAFDPGAPLPAGAQRMLDKLRGLPGITFRPIDMRRFDQELRTVLDIFNDAWAGNWNFLPMSPAEVRHLGTSLKPLLRPEFVVIGEVEGEPAAMTVTLPNVNEAIADLHGRLLPLGWLKLLWRLKVRGTRSARMPLMGIRRRYQATPRGAALALGVIDTVRRNHAAYGTRHAELSWVLEDNRPIRDIIELVGGRPYKTYRIYEKALS
jgi:hypothetical protein